MDLANQRVLVIGLGASGCAACELLRRREARVLAIDNADTPRLRREADPLRATGVDVRLGVQRAPADPLDLVVISPGVPIRSPLVQELVRRDVPLISELELHRLALPCGRPEPQRLIDDLAAVAARMRFQVGIDVSDQPRIQRHAQLDSGHPTDGSSFSRTICGWGRSSDLPLPFMPPSHGSQIVGGA